MKENSKIKYILIFEAIVFCDGVGSTLIHNSMALPISIKPKINLLVFGVTESNTENKLKCMHFHNFFSKMAISILIPIL